MFSLFQVYEIICGATPQYLYIKIMVKFRYYITQKAIDWMYKNADCVASSDFKGYMFTLQPKYDYGVIVNTAGEFAIFTLNPNKKVKRKKIMKALLLLENLGFISYEPEDPFEEFGRGEIPLNISHMRFASKFFSVH